MINDFDQIYKDYLNQVEDRLKDYTDFGKPNSLYDPFKYIMSGGGKRIRPILCMISAGAVGTSPQEAIDSACAIEILHNFTLVHDDIMDESPMRRGRDTIHIKWSEPAAILCGDVMVGYAYRLLPDCKHERSAEILDQFTTGLIEVCEGQAFDMDMNEQKEFTLDDYILTISKKTARLLETSAVIGGHIGKGTPEQIESLRNYAFNLGIAFQIQDDLLDLTADVAKLGKTIGLDIAEGKKTFLIIRAIEKAETAEDKDLLKRFVGENGLPMEFVDEMRQMMERLGVLDDARSEAQKYFETALKYLEELPKNSSTEMLVELTNKINKRNK
jgi:geranylgeranyl diphosphate synthase, type II